MARRKKSDPSGSRMRCDVGSAGAVRTARPSRNHSISGEGDPRALQPRVTGSFLATVIEMGCSVMVGATSPLAEAPDSDTDANAPEKDGQSGLLFH